jgi:hypothetical protein
LQHSPFQCKEINYGAKKQYGVLESTAQPLDKADKKFIQKVCGKFLFLARAIDPTLLCPISTIASQSANPTTDTMKQKQQLLDYIASQEDAVITYQASEMILAAHSDASYLNEPKARSRAGGHFFLSTSADIPPNNGAILNLAHIIKHVMASATEAELAALYIVAREAVYIRINPSVPKPWICVFIGYATENAKNNFVFTGVPANSTMLIIGQNIILPNITKTFAGIFSHRI